jgi:elongation factor G
MKTFKANDIRNVAVMGHAGSGKTMLCESMLVCGGNINRLGSIEAGTTTSDFHEDEQAHGMSLHETVLNVEWLDKKLNILDCPGYLDFIGETLSAYRVSDFALIVINAAHGIEVGTDLVWDFANQLNIPKMFVVNDLDKEHAQFDEVMAKLRDHFTPKLFPLTLPINPGPGFNKLLDVMRSEVVTYADDDSGKYEETAAEGDLKDKVKAYHAELIELVAGADDQLMEKFFEQESLSEEEMRAGLHKALLAESFIPVFCVSAKHDIGVARLMDFIAKYGFSPSDHPGTAGKNSDGDEVEIKSDNQDPVAFVFKTADEAHAGQFSFFRVYSGELNAGSEIYNATRGCHEKLGQLFVMNGKQRESVNKLCAGDIGATIKLKDTHTGNTLCDAKSIVHLPPINYPSPNTVVAVTIENKGDEERLANGLATLKEEDPSLEYLVHPETHQTLLSGQGELHIRIIKETLEKRFRVVVEMEAPKIPFRETIRSKADTTYRHKKQSGGAGQFAEVWLRVAPNDRGSGIEFKHSLTGQNVDRGFVPSVEKGVNAACNEGILAGCRIVDVKVDFYDGKMHSVDSSDIAFQIAGKHAFQEALKKAQPYILEPIYDLKIKVPETLTGDVMSDLSGRRGVIEGLDTEGHFQVIRAKAPQLELYNYTSTLRALTGGRGMFSQSFSHYQELPSHLQQKAVKQRED